MQSTTTKPTTDHLEPCPDPERSRGGVEWDELMTHARALATRLDIELPEALRRPADQYTELVARNQPAIENLNRRAALSRQLAGAIEEAKQP
jgi:hypothetical protein